MNVKILGTGCPNCKRLEAHTRDALHQLGMDADVEKVDDLPRIMQYGVMSTPGLVVDEKVLVSGRVPSTRELVTILGDHC